MERERRDLVNLIASLEQTAGGFAPQIVKSQILDPEQVAGARKGGAYARCRPPRAPARFADQAQFPAQPLDA